MIRVDHILVTAAAIMSVAAALRVWTLLNGISMPAEAPLVMAKPSSPSVERAERPVAWTRMLFSEASLAQSSDSDDHVTGTVSVPSESQLPRLVGVLIRGDERVAVLHYSGKAQAVRESGKIGSWTVVKVDRRSADLRVGSELHVLKLDPGAQ